MIDLQPLELALRALVAAETDHAAASRTCEQMAIAIEVRRPPGPRRTGDTKVYADLDRDGFMASYSSWQRDGVWLLVQGVASPGEGVVSAEGALCHTACLRERECSMRVGELKPKVAAALAAIEAQVRKEISLWNDIVFGFDS